MLNELKGKLSRIQKAGKYKHRHARGNNYIIHRNSLTLRLSLCFTAKYALQHILKRIFE